MISSRIKKIRPRTIQGFFQRNLGLILGVGLFVTFWMLLYTFLVYKPHYSAKATVIIKDSAITSRYIEPEQFYAMQTTSSSSSNPVLNTMSILKSKAISDALWNYFSTQHPEELKHAKIKTKREWNSFFQDGSAFIKAKNQPGTDLIAIQFSWNKAEIAKEALDVIVKAFQDNSRDLNKEEQISRTRFMNKQVAELEAQVEAIRREKSKYQSQKHTISLTREEDDLASSRLELSTRLNQIEALAKGKEDQVRNYQNILKLTPEQALKASALGQNSTMTKLQDEAYRLQQVHSLLQSSLTDNNPKVQEIKAQLDRVNANINDERKRTLGNHAAGGTVVADTTRGTLINTMLQAQGEAKDLRAQASVIRQRLTQVNQDIEKYPALAEGLANISQKEASLSTALDQLRQKVMEGRIKEEQTLSNVFIVDPPRTPEKAQFPTQTHLIVISVLLGFGVGVAVAFAKEQFLSPSDDSDRPSWLEPIEDESEDDIILPYSEEGPRYTRPQHAGRTIETPIRATNPSLNMGETPVSKSQKNQYASKPASSSPTIPLVSPAAYPQISEMLAPSHRALLEALTPKSAPKTSHGQDHGDIQQSDVNRDLMTALRATPVDMPRSQQHAFTTPIGSASQDSTPMSADATSGTASISPVSSNNEAGDSAQAERLYRDEELAPPPDATLRQASHKIVRVTAPPSIHVQPHLASKIPLQELENASIPSLHTLSTAPAIPAPSSSESATTAEAHKLSVTSTPERDHDDDQNNPPASSGHLDASAQPIALDANERQNAPSQPPSSFEKIEQFSRSVQDEQASIRKNRGLPAFLLADDTQAPENAMATPLHFSLSVNTAKQQPTRRTPGVAPQLPNQPEATPTNTLNRLFQDLTGRPVGSNPQFN